VICARVAQMTIRVFQNKLLWAVDAEGYEKPPGETEMGCRASV
jgi:hypothetical protein